MVSMDGNNKNSDRNPVYGAKLSSVVPASVTGEDKVHELSNMDLAMKLHYLKGVYVFREDAVRGLTIYDLKKPMFRWLDLYPAASGRIRRRDDNDDEVQGRPFVKCNDSGVRIVEARCELTVDEWLLKTEEGLDPVESLVHDQVLGPDLGFSPLIFVQFTWFKCGGMSLGLSWAHLLGDIFSASSFINLWAHFLSGHVHPLSLHVPPSPINPNSPLQQPPEEEEEEEEEEDEESLASIKAVSPVGDRWITANTRRMGTLSLHVTDEQLERLYSLSGLVRPGEFSSFELISAVLWKSVWRAREERGRGTAVVCENGVPRGEAFTTPVNGMAFGRVVADFSVAEAEVKEILGIFRRKTDETPGMELVAGKDGGRRDYVAYGAELTFVDLEGLDVGELEIKGKKAVFANYTIGGVGDEGVILILQDVLGKGKGKGMGRRVTMILPEVVLVKLRDELTVTWGGTHEKWNFA